MRALFLPLTGKPEPHSSYFAAKACTGLIYPAANFA